MPAAWPRRRHKRPCLKSGGLRRNDLASKNQKSLSAQVRVVIYVTFKCFNEFPSLYISCTSRLVYHMAVLAGAMEHSSEVRLMPLSFWLD